MSAGRGPQAWAIALAAGLAACSPLSDIPADVCGNGVLEKGEDCDGFARDGLKCRAPGTLGQCHMDCSPASDSEGEGVRCLDGWGCDANGVCRKATGEYQAMPEGIPGKAWALASADFDGDGRADVLASEQPAALGLAKLRVHYFDREAMPDHTFATSALVATPYPLALPGDSRMDLAFAAGGGLGVFSGEPDGSLISEPIPSYFVPQTETRLISVLDDHIRDSVALLVLTRLDGVDGLYRQSRTSARIELIAALPGGVDQLAAEPVTADLRADDAQYPCLDLVLAYRDARELSIYAACAREGLSGMIDWRDDPELTSLPLEPPDRITGALLSADLDGDGHLDLLVGTEHGPYASYGDGSVLGTLQPYPIHSAQEGVADLPMPIAAGDLNGDAIADLVMSDGLLYADASAGPRALRYADVRGKIGAPWSTALIADFNRDGSPDVAAASVRGLDVDFFAGTSSRALNTFTIATDRPVEQLAVGDYDGDLVNDLVLVQSATSADPREEVAIAFGDLQGAPGAPRTTARLQHVQQAASFSNGLETAISNLSLVYDQNDDQGERGSAIALLGGNPDRSLPSLIELSTFQENGALNSALGLAIAVGEFDQPGRTDLIALTLANSFTSGDYELWLLPDIGSRRGTTARLGWGFAPDLQPLLDRDGTPELAGRMTAADLDGDGVAELVVAGPDGTGTRCLVASAHVEPLSATRLVVHPTVVLETPCTREMQLAGVDLDGDGMDDVVLLIGEEREKRLLVLWSDGSQRLDPSLQAELKPEGTQPVAFAPLTAGAGAPLGLVYATRDSVGMLRQGKRARRLEDTGPIAALVEGSGVVAADVDGDGVLDLAVADAGAVRVLRAVLEAL